jgi:hypothetical protein
MWVANIASFVAERANKLRRKQAERRLSLGALSSSAPVVRLPGVGDSLALKSVPLLRVGNGGAAGFPSLTDLNSLSAMTIASGSSGKHAHIDLVERLRPNCES